MFGNNAESQAWIRKARVKDESGRQKVSDKQIAEYIASQDRAFGKMYQQKGQQVQWDARHPTKFLNYYVYGDADFVDQGGEQTEVQREDVGAVEKTEGEFSRLWKAPGRLVAGLASHGLDAGGKVVDAFIPGDAIPDRAFRDANPSSANELLQNAGRTLKGAGTVGVGIGTAPLGLAGAGITAAATGAGTIATDLADNTAGETDRSSGEILKRGARDAVISGAIDIATLGLAKGFRAWRAGRSADSVARTLATPKMTASKLAKAASKNQIDDAGKVVLQGRDKLAFESLKRVDGLKRKDLLGNIGKVFDNISDSSEGVEQLLKNADGVFPEKEVSSAIFNSGKAVKLAKRIGKEADQADFRVVMNLWEEAKEVAIERGFNPNTRHGDRKSVV